MSALSYRSLVMTWHCRQTIFFSFWFRKVNFELDHTKTDTVGSVEWRERGTGRVSKVLNWVLDVTEPYSYSLCYDGGSLHGENDMDLVSFSLTAASSKPSGRNRATELTQKNRER